MIVKSLFNNKRHIDNEANSKVKNTCVCFLNWLIMK